MRHWWQLAMRNWRTRPGRSALAMLSVTLGVAVVVWVTCCYESVRQGITRVVLEWIGSAHIIVEPVEGVWAVFDASLEADIAKVPGVIHTTTRTREYVEAAALARGESPGAKFNLIEMTGVVPEKEKIFRTYRMTAGRFIEPSDKDTIVVEALLADEMKLKVGDSVLIRSTKSPDAVRSFKIVGLLDRRRASLNQAPMTWAKLPDVQSVVGLPDRIKGIDIILADSSVANIQKTAADIRKIIDQRNQHRVDADHEAESLQVKTTETQHKKLDAAQGLLQFIMLLLSCVVLLTSFFIILASMSMGIVERITELGLLRCVGVTRRQLGGLILFQTLPLGLVGTILGLPFGVLLFWLTVKAVPDYLGEMTVSRWGVLLAAVGGIGTTLLGAAIPAVSALAVSPVQAARAEPSQRMSLWLWFSSLTGLVFLAAHELLKRSISGSGTVSFDAWGVALVLLLYGGCALLAPGIVVLLGRIAVILSAALLRLAPQLLGEEIDKAPFRCAAVCSGLMVGLSLIVGLVVWAESVKEGWQFPKEFPDALLYSYEAIPLDEVEALRSTPGVGQFTVCDDFAFSLSRPSKLGFFRSLSMLEQSSRFLAIDPEGAFRIIKLAFLEGNERDAVAKLKQGHHVLVTREFANARRVHLGDGFEIWVDDKSAKFTVAGVIGAPGVDIAISFFNATDYFQFYAVGAIFGTREDAEKLFGRRYGKLVLFNFNLPNTDTSRIVSTANQAIAPRPSGEPGKHQSMALGPGPIPEAGPEERIVNSMLKQLGYPPKAFVTARELKQQIDRNINRVTLLLSAAPVVALLISALGLANLMAANVASRSKQIAVLRAVGVTRGQVSRMVLGEALVVGLLGSGLGLALGLLLARTSNFMTQLLSGFEPAFTVPWGLVTVGACLATLMCILAAWIPARRASRANIVAVLSSL